MSDLIEPRSNRRGSRESRHKPARSAHSVHPGAVERKLIERYGIDLSRPTRSRRKAAGLANLHLLRYGRFFVLVATHGKRVFFADEASSIGDVRSVPLQFHGYSISVKRGDYLPKAQGEPSAAA